jgi:hypothetical protein
MSVPFFFRKPDPASNNWEGDCHPWGDGPGPKPVSGGRNHITPEAQLREAGRAIGLEGAALERRVADVMHNQARRWN